MLVLNLKRIAGMRGIKKVYSYLTENGMTHSLATKICTEKPINIKIVNIGRLCVLFNCTPNDLFEWREDAEEPISETHALRAIIKEPQPKNFLEILKELPADKLPEVENLLKQLKDR